MMDYQSAPSPAVNPPHLRVVRDEEAPGYDVGREPARRRMSFVKMPTAVVTDAALSDRAVRLYALLMFHNGDRGCFPTRQTLARECGAGVKSVERALTELVDRGYIQRRKRGFQGATHYTFNSDTGDVVGDPIATQVTTNSDTGDAPIASPVSHRTRTIELETLRENVPPLLSPQDQNGQSAEALPLPLPDDAVGLRTDEPSPPDSGDPPAPTPKKPRPADPPGFVEFWAAYPKGHGSRKAAADWWRQHKPDDAAVAEIMAGLAAWHRSRRWREGYVKDAERWLRGRLWENPPPAGAASNGAIPETSDDGGLAAWRASGVRS
jgi:hypothetical protein